MNKYFLASIFFTSLNAFSVPANISATVSTKVLENRTEYKISIINKDESQRLLIVGFGESCTLGKQIDVEKYGFDLIPILNNQGRYSPNMLQTTDIFNIDADNYLKLSSIEASSGNEKMPFVDSKATKEIVFYTVKKNNNLMLDLPLCIQAVGGTNDEIELIVSEENWAESDAGFDVETSIKTCKGIYPGVAVDPNEGDHRYQCKEPKYQYLATLPALQFSCVLEKRLKYRLLNLEKNRKLQILRDQIAAQPTKTKLLENYSLKQANVRANLTGAINNQNKEIESLKTKTETLRTKIGKSCKM